MAVRRIIVVIIICACFWIGCGDIGAGDRQGDDMTGGTTTLILGTAYVNSSLRKQVDNFNRQNTGFFIEIKEYGGELIEGSSAVDLMQMEISAGKGPDIIDFGYQYSPGVVSKGITEDLYAYMEADVSFDEEDYFTNIVDTYAVGGKLYALSPDFSIKTVAGTKEQLGDAGQWNMKDLMAFYQENTEGGMLFPGDSQKEVFGFLCLGSMGNFVNWAEGTCSFDSELFRELLAFSGQFPERRVYGEDYSVLQQFLTGKALLYPVSISDVYDCTKVRLVFGGSQVSYIGYPMDGKDGNTVVPGRFILGINKNSDNKEAAWGFIKSFLEEEYQSSIEGSLPLLRSEVLSRQEEAKRVEYEDSPSGGRVETVKASVIFEGEEPIDITCIEEQDAVCLLDVIGRVETTYAADAELYSIILEEIIYYFENDSDIDAVVDIIQNRASIYVSEQH